MVDLMSLDPSTWHEGLHEAAARGASAQLLTIGSCNSKASSCIPVCLSQGTSDVAALLTPGAAYSYRGGSTRNPSPASSAMCRCATAAAQRAVRAKPPKEKKCGAVSPGC